MKKAVFLITSVLFFTGIGGCAYFNPRSVQQAAVSLPPYSGPKVKIVVADFETKSAKSSEEISSALRSMFVNALIQSNRFNLVEPQETTQAKAGAQGELIISTQVVEFEPEVSGGRSGIGGGGGQNNGVLGALMGTPPNKAHLVLDIRIVDSASSGVLAASQIQGQAQGGSSESSLGGGFPPALIAYKNTPMENALRNCILKAVRYISENIPANYYRE